MPGTIYYDDIIGNLVTAESGGATWINRYLRRTNELPVYPHIAKGDIFAMTFQLSHRKTLYQPIPSVHLHWVPALQTAGGTPADGTTNIRINWSWGWYNRGETIPATLPNTGTADLPVVSLAGAGDLWKLKINNLITNLTPPANEEYSSILMVRCLRPNTGDDTYTGEFALVYMDAHMPVDSQGSMYEYRDYPPGTL